MTIDDKIRNGKLQYDNNRETSKISVLYHPKKLINTNILRAKEYFLLIEAK